MAAEPIDELNAIVEDIVGTEHPRKIVVAGAGAGKTFTFKKLLDALPASPAAKRLVVTFLGGLKRDLEKDLGDKAIVQTFHGYCFGTLKQNAAVRGAAGFSPEVRYFPRTVRLVKSDWMIANGGKEAEFLPSLRKLTAGDELEFMLGRARYYDAVGHDDSVVHLHRTLTANAALVPTFDLVIVDEVQDLNGAEISMLHLLSTVSPVVLAGDDDQALYGDLRDASEEHIRSIHARDDYMKANLPYCMRCPPVVVHATNDIIAKADAQGLLGKRIAKRYDPFPKPDIDKQYPSIKIVETTTQLPASNLFGKYIKQKIDEIPAEEIEESNEKGFPTALIIGSKPYAGQVLTYLEQEGYHVETKAPAEEQMSDPFVPADAFEILRHSPNSNLGWRIMLEVNQPVNYEKWVLTSLDASVPLIEIIDPAYRDKVLNQVETWVPEESEPGEEVAVDATKPTVRLTTFEGAKGMSAQHVFILAPDFKPALKAVDVRRMLVALTRARRQAYLLRATLRFGKGKPQYLKPSLLLDWISWKRKSVEKISANTFKN